MVAKEVFTLRIQMCIFAIAVGTSFSEGYTTAIRSHIMRYVRDWIDYEVNTKVPRMGVMQTVLGIQNHNLIEFGFCAGAIIGSLLIPKFSEKFGRKGSLLLTNFITIFGVLFAGYSRLFDIANFLIFGRFILGINSGLVSAFAPMYLMEIMPRRCNGTIGAIYAFYNVVGVTCGSFAALLLPLENYWPLSISLIVLPCILQLWLLPLFPESPKYLFVIKRKDFQAIKAAMWLRGSTMLREEREELEYELYQRTKLGNILILDLHKNKILLKALLITNVVVCSQALCGARILTTYVVFGSIYNEYEKDTRLVQFAMSATCLSASLVTIFIIDNISRRILIIASFAIMTFSCLTIHIVTKYARQVLKANYLLMMLYIVGWRLGCGCIAHFIVSEYFNTVTVPIAYSTARVLYWLAKTCQYTADLLDFMLEDYMYLTYALINGSLTCITYKTVIDTRNLPIKDVYKKLHDSIKK